jgi:hypothetical protein
MSHFRGGLLPKFGSKPCTAVACMTTCRSHLSRVSYGYDRLKSSAMSSVKTLTGVVLSAKALAIRRKKNQALFPSHAQLLGPSTQTIAADSRPVPSFQLATAAAGFFAPRQPSIYHPVTDSNILGSSSVANITGNEDHLGTRYVDCVFVISDHTALIEPQLAVPTITVPCIY